MTVNFSADARPNLDGPERAAIARNRRAEATKIAFDQSVRPSPVVPSNGDNAKYASLPMAFAKGLLHDAFGMVDPAAVKALATVLTDVGGMADKPSRDMAEVAPYTASSAYQKWADAKYPKDGRLVSCLKAGQTSKDVQFRAWESPLAGLYYSDEGPDWPVSRWRPRRSLARASSPPRWPSYTPWRWSATCRSPTSPSRRQN